MDNKFVKLGDLDGQNFTVNKAWGFSFKKWDEASRKMLVEQNWQESMRGDRNWRKIYAVDTDKGKMDLSEKQLKDMLGGVYRDGVADVNGRTFTVKKVIGQNDIPNYYINPVKGAPVASTRDSVAEVIDDEPINLDALGW